MKAKNGYEYRLIDGNWTWHPVAYCKSKKGYLTQKLMNTHGCEKCMHLDMEDEGG